MGPAGRLGLREFTPGDLEAVHAFASDPLVCRWTDWGPNTLADTRAFLDAALVEAVQEPRRSWSLAVVRVEDGRLVGSAAVWDEQGRGGLGFAFHRDAWGQGFATETTGLLLAVAWGQLGLQRVEATCRPGNVASRRALERAGFVVEGLLPGHALVRGVRQDSLLLAAVRG